MVPKISVLQRALQSKCRWMRPRREPKREKGKKKKREKNRAPAQQLAAVGSSWRAEASWDLLEMGTRPSSLGGRCTAYGCTCGRRV